MVKIPVYRTEAGENFIAITQFKYIDKIFCAILNLLDESFSDNDLIRYPIIEAIDSLTTPIKLIGYMTSTNFQHILWPAFHRLKDSENLKTPLDIILVDELTKALDQSLS